MTEVLYSSPCPPFTAEGSNSVRDSEVWCSHSYLYGTEGKILPFRNEMHKTKVISLFAG